MPIVLDFGGERHVGVHETSVLVTLFVCLHKQRHEQTHGMKKMLAPFLLFFTHLNTMHMLHDVRLFSVTRARCFFLHNAAHVQKQRQNGPKTAKSRRLASK